MSGVIIAGKCDIEDLLTVNNSIVLDSDNFTSGTSLTFKNDSVSPKQVNMSLKSSNFELKDNNNSTVLYFDHSNSSDYIYINRPLQLSGGSSYVNYNALGSDYVQGVVRVTGQDVRVESSTANMLVYCDSNHDIKSTGITPTQLSAMNTISSNAVVKNPTAPQVITGYQLKLDDGTMTVVRGLSTNWAYNSYATGDAQSRMVATAGGLFLFGDGTNSQDVSFGRRGVGIIGTGYKFEAGQGLRATGYDGANLTGSGVEMHLTGGVGRILSYNRDTGTRLPLRLDGMELQFNTNNGTPRATLTSAGLFSLNNLTGDRVVVTDGSKNLVSSPITTTELNYLDNVSSNIQDQIDNCILGSGTAEYFPKFSAAKTLTNSTLAETTTDIRFTQDKLLNLRTGNQSTDREIVRFPSGGIEAYYDPGGFATGSKWYDSDGLYQSSITLDNGQGNLISNDVLALSWGLSGIDHLQLASTTYTGSSEQEPGSLHILNSDDNGTCVVTLSEPSPGIFKIFTGDAGSTTAPVLEAITPPTGCIIRYVSSAGETQTKTAGQNLQIVGRCIMLVGVSSTEWRVVGSL